MAKGKNSRIQEVQPEATDSYWGKLVRGIHAHGSDAEHRALSQVMHSLRHADLHPSERLGNHIGHGKVRRLPRRYRETGN